jgi:hypothetical protein
MGLSPDIITLSKSLSGYGLPMAIVLMKPGLDRWRPGEHTATFRGNNLAFVAATAALELFWHDEALARAIESKSQLLRQGLEAIRRRYPAAQATSRGRGLLYGLACDVPGLAQKITQAAFAKGLVIETSGAASQVVKCLPPLVIDTALLEAGLAILNQSVAAAVGASFTNLEEPCRPLWASPSPDARLTTEKEETMLQLRPNCECCDKDLPPESTEAMMCSFECTFCTTCAQYVLHGQCPNCNGELVRRPIRPPERLVPYPASTHRVVKSEGCHRHVGVG